MIRARVIKLAILPLFSFQAAPASMISLLFHYPLLFVVFHGARVKRDGDGLGRVLKAHLFHTRTNGEQLVSVIEYDLHHSVHEVRIDLVAGAQETAENQDRRSLGNSLV